MPCLMLDGKSIEIEPGMTILDAAQRLRIRIPTLCHLQGTQPFTSCMVCAVKDTKSGRLLPSCSAPARDGMVLETDTEEVRQHRRNVLDLLLSEHVGDCEAPCRVTCPARLNVPLLLRQIEAGQTDAAIATARDSIAMPGVIGHICPAPCEKACRRGRHDAPVSICQIERWVGETALANQLLHEGPYAPISGKRVAVVGAGPAGLSSALYLARAGHACTVFDEHAQPGGQIRYRASHAPVPFAVLDQEVELIRQLGVEFRMNTRIDLGAGLALLKSQFDAVVLAPGKFASASLSDWGLTTDSRGIKVNGATLRSSDPGVFAGGEAIHPGRMAVRAMAHGKTMACSIDQYLRGKDVVGVSVRFDSRLGALKPAETDEMMKQADVRGRVEVDPPQGLTSEQARQESRRCLHCDCRKAESCQLRELAELTGASQKAFTLHDRAEFKRNVTHSRVIFEPGKCIKCGICVRITNGGAGTSGLAFIGRGFETVVGVPFDGPMETALGDNADECVRNCPTGALAWKHD